MAAAFGFSTGDFVAGLELVGIVIDALRESGESSSQYRELIAQLYTLESALLRVKNLDLDVAQHAEIIALRQAAAQCQQTIDNFWKKIEKYQPSLRTGGSGNKVKDGWRKVQWALCKKDDIIKFRADLMGHTEAIHLLLATVQLNAIRIDSKKTEENCQSLVVQTREAYSGFMQRMQAILSGVTTGLEQGRQLFKTTARILQINVEVFQMVLNIQTMMTRIPGQVDRQQPVHLIDALGHHRPFHLEFVTSYRAFVYVLQEIFQDVGSGAAKIANGEFVIQDSATQKDVALYLPWKVCFHPGQRIAMSMLFYDLRTRKVDGCPKCKSHNTAATPNQEIECSNCQLVYSQCDQSFSIAPQDFSAQVSQALEPAWSETETKEFSDKDTIEHGVSIFRRVRISSAAIPEEYRWPEFCLPALNMPPALIHTEDLPYADSSDAGENWSDTLSLPDVLHHDVSKNELDPSQNPVVSDDLVLVMNSSETDDSDTFLQRNDSSSSDFSPSCRKVRGSRTPREPPYDERLQAWLTDPDHDPLYMCLIRAVAASSGATIRRDHTKSPYEVRVGPSISSFLKEGEVWTYLKDKYLIEETIEL